MTSQDSPRTVRVIMCDVLDTLPRDVLGLRQTMTSQDSPRTARVIMCDVLGYSAKGCAGAKADYDIPG